MKYLLLIFSLALLLSASNCNQDSSGPSSLEVNGEAAPAQMPPNDMRETRILTSRFWVFEHWVDVDRPGDTSNKGRWYRFYQDGTYDGGHWEDHNDHGTWFLRQGEEYTELFVDSEINDLKDAKWQIQGISGSEDAMSWVKTHEFGDKRGAMCKMMPLLSMPTKAQFGVE